MSDRQLWEIIGRQQHQIDLLAGAVADLTDMTRLGRIQIEQHHKMLFMSRRKRLRWFLRNNGEVLAISCKLFFRPSKRPTQQRETQNS